MDSQDRVLAVFLAGVAACIVVGIFWWGYFEVTQENLEERTRQVVVRSCQEELDTNLVECVYQTTAALDGEEPRGDE